MSAPHRRRAAPVLAVAAALCAAPAHAGRGGAANLANGGFESLAGDAPDGWTPFEAGCSLDGSVRHSGARSLRCAARTDGEAHGAVYTVTLDQRAPTPIVISAWSRAEGVGGVRDGEYAIYVDLTYRDGTPLYGQTAPFAVGSHDWQREQLVITPTAPVATMQVYALFRSHVGTAWFDDFSLGELSATGGLFDGQALSPPSLPGGTTRGWFVRDVAAASPVVPLAAASADADGAPPTATADDAGRLGLRLSATRVAERGRVAYATVEDTRGKPRAVTVYYVERWGDADVTFWHDLRRRVPAGASGERTELASVGVGATGSIARYPFQAVTTSARGRALGVPPTLGPRVYRIGYHAGARLFYVAFDVALTGDNAANSDGKGHGRAEVAVVRYDVDPAWGFRAAAATFYALFPDAYTRRATAEGIWIPFTDPGKVEHPEDFGFAYHEGDNSVAGDDRRGILSFRYAAAPTVCNMPMPRGLPRTYDKALELLQKQARGGDADKRRVADAVLAAGAQGPDGRFNVEFRNDPWNDGAVWFVNPNPRIPRGQRSATPAALAYSKELADSAYAARAGGLDGEFLDSLEDGATVLDFNAQSLRHSPAPPTFTTSGARPVIPTWFSTVELITYMRDDLHRRGKLVMGNTTPIRINAFAPLLDVMGIEVNSLETGRYRPESDADFNYRRVLSYRKPYLLLENTDLSKLTSAMVRRFFERSMFYGVFPSLFSADASSNSYWEQPRLYNRDRALFKRYVPAVQALSRAGWEPITYARSDAASVYVERWGGDYLTLLNDGAGAATANVTVELFRFWSADRLRGARAVQVVDGVDGRVLATAPASPSIRVPVALGPDEARMLRLVPVPR